MILDTSVIVSAERGVVGLEAFLSSLGDEPVGVAAVTASELLHGCHRAATPAIRARRSAFVEAFLDIVPVLPFGLPEARRHAELWAELARRGSPIGAHDMLIGATALARGEMVATLNTKDFRRIAGLRLATLDRYL